MTLGHVCCTFVDEAHKQAVVRRFLEEGVEAGDRVLYFDEHGDDRFLGAALAPRYDLDRLLDSGQLSLGDATAVYFEGGVFDGRARAAGFEAVVQEALAAGYRRVRVYADNGWMPAALDDPEEWLDYEVRVGRTISSNPLIGLCGFHDSDPQVLRRDAVDATHRDTLNDGERPSAFTLYAEPDAWVLAGEVDVFAREVMTRLFAGAARVDASAPVDLAGLRFVDGAGAAALGEVLLASGLRAANPSRLVRRVWDARGLDASLIGAAA